MFSHDIVGSDAFLDMGVGAQLLYFHLAMRADDDGFVNPKAIMRMVGAAEDDLKVLLAKRFLLPFDSGVVVIKHWLIHNLIRADLYKETTYKKEKSTIGLNENGAYTELKNGKENVHEIKKIDAPKWLKLRKKTAYRKRTANVPQTARRLGKDRLVKNNIVRNPEGFRLAQFLYEKIRENYAGAKEPNWDAWSADMAKLLEKDKRSVEEVEYMISWCQADNFWAGNILSPGKLRKQWDKLAIIISKQKK